MFKDLRFCRWQIAIAYSLLNVVWANEALAKDTQIAYREELIPTHASLDALPTTTADSLFEQHLNSNANLNALNDQISIREGGEKAALPSEARPQPDSISQPQIAELPALPERIDWAIPQPSGSTEPQAIAMESSPTDPMAQVTSVSQLSDVQPTDWAFQALQSLVERYGCIAGYPDGTYRGDRSLTRYEFAAGLNACLDRILEITGTGGVTDTDLDTIRALQEQFTAELATIRGRVDALETRVAEVEANQFSTTTQLSGQLILGLAGATGAYPGAGEPEATPGILSNTGGTPGNDTQVGLNYRLRLNLTTSFTGQDLLITGLQAYNFLGDPNSIQGTLGYSDPLSLNASTVRLGFEPQFPGTNPQTLTPLNPNDLRLYKLLYVFPSFLDDVTFFVGTNAEVTDAFPAVSPFANDTQGALSRFAPYNAAVRVSGGTSGTGLASAGGFIWNIADSVNLTALYGSVNAPLTSNQGLTGGTPLGAGLFGGSYVATAQLTLTPSDRLQFGLNYAHSYHQINILGTGLSSSDIGSILFDPNAAQLAAVGGNPVLAIANEGIQLNSLGATLNWRFLDDVSFVASGAYIFADLVDVDASTNFINWMVGLHLQDIFDEGNSAGILFGQPLHRDSIGGVAFNPENAEPYHLEGYISFRVSDNITLTPGIFAVFNPEGYSGNDTAVVGVLRTALTF
ncbi:MAG: iron uptake porin [Thainema sp.]